MSVVGDLVGGIFGGNKSGGSQPVQTQKVNAEPWDKQKPFFTDDKKGIYNLAHDLYQKPQEYYGGNTVVPFSGDTSQGMDSIRSMAGQPNQLYQSAAQGTQGVLDRGGYSQNFDQFAAPMMGIASGDNRIDTSRMENIAGGGMLGQNPYIDKLVDQVSNDASGAVNRNAFFSGREASPYHAGAVAEQVGKLSNQIRGQDYAQERGYMDSAMNSLANVQGTNIANQYQSAQGLLGADNLAQTQLGAFASQAPNIDQFGYANAARMMDLGQMQEGKAAEQIQDDLARFNFEQQEPSDRLARYAAMVEGTPVMSNASQSTFAPAPTPTGSGILGGALQGAQIGSVIPGIGTGFGALGGGLLSMF